MGTMTLEQALARIQELEQQAASMIRVSPSREGNMVCISGCRAYPWTFYPSEAVRVFNETTIKQVLDLANEMLPHEVKKPRETESARNNGRIYRR